MLMFNGGRMPEHQGGIHQNTGYCQDDTVAPRHQDDGDRDRQQQERDQRVGVASGKVKPEPDQYQIGCQGKADKNRRGGRAPAEP